MEMAMRAGGCDLEPTYIEDAVWFAVLLDFANLNPVTPSVVYATHHHVAVAVCMNYVTFLYTVLMAEVSKYMFFSLIVQYPTLSLQCVNLPINFLNVLVDF